MASKLNALKASTAIAMLSACGLVVISQASANENNANWAGGSFGVHTGWGIGQSENHSDYSNPDYMSNDTDITGAIFGFHAAYDWALSHGLILGLGASLSGTDINGTALDKYCDPECGGFDETKVEALASVTGRLGWVGNDPSTLFYARGGLAWAQVHYGWLPSDYSESHELKKGHVGWTVGAGVEKSLSYWPGVTASLEYNYYNFFGDDDLGKADGYNMDGEVDIHTVMFGLNLRPGMNGGDAHVGPNSESYDWSGVSVGFHGGWAAGGVDSASEVGSDEPFENETNVNGGLLGLRFGYDWDLQNNWVIGVGASISGTDINGFTEDTYTEIGDHSGFDETKIDSLASITGRIGWKGDNPSTLYYVRGGFAQAHVEYGWVPESYDVSYTGSNTHNGWTVGVGKEQAMPFWPGATGFLEYNYYNFGEHQGISNNSDLSAEGKLDIHAIMVGVNFRPWQHTGEDEADENSDSDITNAWWSGLSVGVHAGWSIGDSDTRSDWDSDSDMGSDISGGQIGVQAGYDWAVAENWIFGVGVSAVAADINGFGEDDDCATGCGDMSEVKIDALASVTGRVGWNGSDPSTLYYARGGVAFAHANYDWQPSSYDSTFSGSNIHSGWTVGAGVEKKVPMFNNATLFAEYNYFDFGDWDRIGIHHNDDEYLDGKFNFHTAKIGMNFKFNGPMQ